MKIGTIRQIPIMLLLNAATCGLYHIYWVYKTSNEIKYFMEREDLNPALEIILGIITSGLYFKYWYYKYGKIVYKEMPLKAGMDNTEDKTIALVIIDIIVYLIYIFSVLFSFLMIMIVSRDPSSPVLLFILPPVIIYSLNISGLIMQDKLNNIWKKV